MDRAPLLPLLFFAAGCPFFSGCSQSGPSTFPIAGTVTFDGKPVEAGRVDFFPDLAKGNDGPQGFAIIKGGKFDTRQGGQGHAGGAMVVRIEGFDGKASDLKLPQHLGNRIFNVYEINLDLPKEACEKTFEVPASAAKGLVVRPRSKS